jgi:tRNA(fMet)-specific endonuclease VapC
MGEIKYLLDSNICIHFLKNDIKVVDKLHEVGFINCHLSEITILELLYGVANSISTKKDANKLKLKLLEESFDDRILPIRLTFESFSIQKTYLRKLGTPISDFDLLIGCTALVQDLTLVSRNVKEMQRIEGIKLENWID